MDAIDIFRILTNTYVCFPISVSETGHKNWLANLLTTDHRLHILVFKCPRWKSFPVLKRTAYVKNFSFHDASKDWNVQAQLSQLHALLCEWWWAQPFMQCRGREHSLTLLCHKCIVSSCLMEGGNVVTNWSSSQLKADCHANYWLYTLVSSDVLKFYWGYWLLLQAF